MVKKPQRIRDPLHNLIEFNDKQFEQALWRIIQTPSFQRLRRIKQLGFSDFVYPGATHSRFAHSLGVFCIARQLLRVIKDSADSSFNEARNQHALAAALVHDVGHGPFSHAFEDVGKRLSLPMASHEEVTALLITEGEIGKILDEECGIRDNVAQMIKAPTAAGIYGSLVSSQFDADRLDYMQRDRLMTGTQTGAIDFKWLLSNLKIEEVPYGVDDRKLGTQQTFVLEAKAIHAAESYILGLFQLYSTVYLHKTTRGIEKLFTELMVRIFELAMNGSSVDTGLPPKHPLVQFAQNPGSLALAQKLDDAVIMGALPLLQEAADPIVKEFSTRIFARNILKCIDISEILRCDFASSEKNIAIASEEIKYHVKGWCEEYSGGIPRLLSDEGARMPYKIFGEDKSPLNRIIVRTSSRHFEDISKCSALIAGIKPFNFYRIYVAEDDTEAKNFVESTITQCIEELV